MSEAAIIWVDDVLKGLGPYRKGVLRQLASVSDDDDFGWMTVALLADRVGCSERKVQYTLRQLVADGLLRETGRTYRKGTRLIPYYELMVDHVAVAQVIAGRARGKVRNAEIHGRTLCTHAPAEAVDNGAPCTRMGAPACTPNEDIRGEEEADASSPGARAGEMLGRLVEIWPTAALDNTDREAAGEALEQIAGEIGDLTPLLRAAEGYLADQAKAKRDHPVKALHRWLAGRHWEHRVSRAACAVAAPDVASAPTGWDGPAEVRAAFVAAWGGGGEARAASYVDPARWDADARAVVARTRTAFGILNAAAPALKALNVTILPPEQA